MLVLRIIIIVYHKHILMKNLNPHLHPSNLHLWKKLSSVKPVTGAKKKKSCGVLLWHIFSLIYKILLVIWYKILKSRLTCRSLTVIKLQILYIIVFFIRSRLNCWLIIFKSRSHVYLGIWNTDFLIHYILDCQ